MWCKDAGRKFGKTSLNNFEIGMKIHMMKYLRYTSSCALKKDKTMKGLISSGYNHYTVYGI